MEPFRNRLQAGQLLAQQLEEYAGRQDLVVMALPRGGVPVGYAIASRLDCPLDVLSVAKIGLPGHEDTSLGAVSSRGICVLRPETIAMMNFSPNVIEAMAQKELSELRRRELAYRAIRPPVELRNKLVVLADDGLVSGATMLAAVRALRHEHPAEIVVSVPIASTDGITELRTEVEKVNCLLVPDWLTSVEQWYEDSSPIDDFTVMAYLREAAHWRHPEEAGMRRSRHAHSVAPDSSLSAKPF